MYGALDCMFLSVRCICVYVLIMLRTRFKVNARSGGIMVRIPQKLDVVVFCSWNLDVVAFRPLKECLVITMSWLNCLFFSMSWCFSPRTSMSRFFGLGISMSCFFGLGISMSWYVSPRPRFRFHSENRKTTQNILNYVKEYFNYRNLCNSYPYK